jgi:hypothetical protein
MEYVGALLLQRAAYIRLEMMLILSDFVSPNISIDSTSIVGARVISKF